MTKEEKRKTYKKEWTRKNKEKIAAQKKAWYERNKERVDAYRKNWENENREKVREYKSKWKKENKDKVNAHTAKRRSVKNNACPDWVDLEKIKVLYEKAKWLESLTGLKYHVDHIIPLTNENVCGLHCWNNLQILEESINIDKSNEFEGNLT